MSPNRARALSPSTSPTPSPATPATRYMPSVPSTLHKPVPETRPYSPPQPSKPVQPQTKPYSSTESKRPSPSPARSATTWQEVTPGGDMRDKKPSIPTPTPSPRPNQFQQRASNPFVNPSPARWQQIPEPQPEFSFFSQLLLPLLLGTYSHDKIMMFNGLTIEVCCSYGDFYVRAGLLVIYLITMCINYSYQKYLGSHPSAPMTPSSPSTPVGTPSSSPFHRCVLTLDELRAFFFFCRCFPHYTTVSSPIASPTPRTPFSTLRPRGTPGADTPRRFGTMTPST